MSAETIITHLIDGNPQWIKTCELFNWIWKAYVIPRAKIKEVKQREELQTPSLYFLFGETEDELDQAYIWQSENGFNRVLEHTSKKDFWNIAVIFVSTANNLTAWDIRFLEFLACRRAQENWNYIVSNSISPKTNNLPQYQITSMEKFFDNINLLLSTLGFPVLKQKNIDEKEIIYSLTNRWASARWIYSEEWFTVLAWSRWPLELVKWTKENNGYAMRHRPKLIKAWLIKQQWEEIIFLKDHTFSSPSGASDVVVWRSTNWWTTWKDAQWKTLHDNERVE